jgi:hypothetical protein
MPSCAQMAQRRQHGSLGATVASALASLLASPKAWSVSESAAVRSSSGHDPPLPHAVGAQSMVMSVRVNSSV